MSKTKKPENYTSEMVERLKEVYNPVSSESERDAQIIALSEELRRNPRSVRSKLSSLGVYVKKEYKAKTGVKPETKEAIVTAIAEILGVDADASLPGLQNAGKNALVLLRRTFEVLTQEPAESDQTATVEK